MESEISDNDKYVDLKPIWMDESESYYPSRVLEEKLESIEKKHYELSYEHMELKNNYKSMETELKTMKEEKLKSETLSKTNIAQLPIYRSKIVELKKKIKELTSGKKNLEIDISNYISKSKSVDEQLKHAKSENFTLTINNTKLLQKIKDFEDGKLKNIRDTDKVKLENEKIKATIIDLKIELLAYKSQIASLNEQLKVKDITSNGLILDNKIKDTNIKQCRDENYKHQKYVTVAEKKCYNIEKICRKSISEHAGLEKENMRLREEMVTNTKFIDEIEELKIKYRLKVKELKEVQSMLRKQESEITNQRNQIAEVEKLKVRYIYTGKDITEYKKEILLWKDKYTDLRFRFDNLDCPFYQSKLNKKNVPDETICGVLNEKHYISRIHVLELKIKTLYEEKESLKDSYKQQYLRVKNKCVHDLKQAEAKVKTLKKTLEPFQREIANRDGTISTQDKQLRLQSTMISNEKDKNELGTQSRIFAKKVIDLHSVIQANKKEYIESRRKIENLEATITKLRHRNENLERSLDNIVVINKSIVECNNDQPARSYNSTEESLQKQIYKLQDQINEEKSKNSNLLNQIKTVKNLKEIDHKFSTKSLNDALVEIRKLTNLNKNLTLKNNGLEKYKRDNNILKSKTKDVENRLTYMQHKLTNLDNKKMSQILNTGVLEMVHPEIKKNRVTNNQLVKTIIECRTKLKESNLANEQV